MQTRSSFSSHGHNISNVRGKAIFASAGSAFLLFLLTLSLCLTPGTARAQMAQLSEENLMGITGQSGVSINMDGVYKLHYDVLKFSDTQATRNWIELYDVNMGDGAGGGFSFATHLLRPDPTALSSAVVAYITTYGAPGGLSGGFIANDPTTWTLADFGILDALNDPSIDPPLAVYQEARMPDPITIDVATKDAADSSSIPVGTTFTRVRNTSSINPRWISVGSLVLNAYSTNVTNSSYLSNTVGHYLTANSLTNAQLVANLGLNAAFDYSDPTTWIAGDVTLLVATLDPGLATLASAYSAPLGDFHLQTQPLGSIALDGLRQGPSVYRYWAPAVGQGIRFDYTTTISADRSDLYLQHTAPIIPEIFPTFTSPVRPRVILRTPTMLT